MGEGGQGTQKIVYQKWPDQIFPVANFVFSHDGHFGLDGGGPGGVTPPPPAVYGHSNAGGGRQAGSVGLPVGPSGDLTSDRCGQPGGMCTEMQQTVTGTWETVLGKH